MEKVNTFEITEVVDLTENNTFTILNDAYNNVATMVIKDSLINVYFEKGTTKEFGSDFDKMLDWVNDNNYKFIKWQNGNHHWKEYNPNPKEVTKAGDCSIRAYCSAFDITWDEAYKTAYTVAKDEKYMMNDKKMCKKILEEEFNCTIDEQYKKDKKKEKITVNKFAMTHPYGIYILMVPSHMVCVRNGEYWDTWDCGDKKVSEIYNVVKK